MGIGSSSARVEGLAVPILGNQSSREHDMGGARRAAMKARFWRIVASLVVIAGGAIVILLTVLSELGLIGVS